MGEAATNMFVSITGSNNIPINMCASTKLRIVLKYTKGWRVKLWNHAYTRDFKSKDAFKKFDSFKDFRSSMLAIEHLIYRYVSNFNSILVLLYVAHSTFY